RHCDSLSRKEVVQLRVPPIGRVACTQSHLYANGVQSLSPGSLSNLLEAGSAGTPGELTRRVAMCG
ncbi:hypothetical protein NHH03_22095, partial [Stieleria sp. TO1_6]|uniref:hypothetical protein n=1 Tax=Stieleria tagensis TaxID=2956795 RepID=UPI00209B23E7